MEWPGRRPARYDDLEFRLACREAATEVARSTVSAREVTVVGFVAGSPVPVAGFGLLPGERSDVLVALDRLLTGRVRVPGSAPRRRRAAPPPETPDRFREGDWGGFTIRVAGRPVGGPELVVVDGSDVIGVDGRVRPLRAEVLAAAPSTVEVRGPWVWVNGVHVVDADLSVDDLLVAALGVRGGAGFRARLRDAAAPRRRWWPR